MPPSQNPPIFLLKTAATPRDLYDEYFRNEFRVSTHDNNSYGYGFDPVFVPVLSHRMHAENLARVESFFTSQNHQNGGGDDEGGGGSFIGENRTYGGMIFTSQRAVEAFRHILEQGNIPASTSQNMVLYTVGPATTRLLTPLRDQYLPHARIAGEEAGTGEKLAQIMLNDYNPSWNHTTNEEQPKPALLFLVGEQRRDIIPRTLMSDSLEEHRRIRVDELVVYETTEMPGFEESLRDAVASGEQMLDSLNNSDKNLAATMWVTVFSPTGCDALLRVVGELSSSRDEPKKKCLIVTIGPTTRDHLRIKYSVEPDAVAEVPSPEGVGEAIRRFYNTNTQ